MAAEMVIWENLKTKLGSREVELLLPLKKELDRLLVTVKTAQTGVAALDRHNLLQGNLDIVPARRDERSDTLKRLSTWLYDADNLLDQIVTIDQHTRLNKEKEEENPSNLVQQVVHVVIRSAQEMSLFLSSSNQYGYPTVSTRRLIGGMREGLKDLVRELLNQLRGNKQPEQTQSPPITSFSPIQLKLTGREDDKRDIVKLLLQPPEKRKSNVSVVCICAQPGVGKSALAKEIYDDLKVTAHFDLRMWIPVTDITDESEVIRQIVESCTNRRSNYHNSLVPKNYADSFRDFLGCQSSGISTSSPNNGAHDNETEIYERRLRNEIRGKHYLLILDDVCLQTWQRLRDLLAGGARGSKILMTTGTEEADILIRETPEVQAYTLYGLGKSYSWNLFEALALDHNKSCDAEMKSIGFEIAEICNHVPLTIIVAARFLHGKSRDMWFSFIKELRLGKDQGSDVMDHVLHLSYANLPTHLRACFGYCALFPTDFTFNKYDLISRWIAQGFVNPRVGRSLEDEGEIYFIELSRRFLLEEVSTDDFGNTLTCKMHHVISIFASKVATGVLKLQLIDSCIYVPDHAKHVSVNCRGDSLLKLPTPVLNHPSLRTLIFIKEPDCLTNVNTQVCHQLLSCYRRLRVLDLYDLGVKELPDSIGGQVHLRYLDLSKNDALVTLPKSFTRLYNLQTLILNSCPKLKLLDIDFRQLANLKRLEVDGCESLSSMPLGLGKLTELVTLSRFVVGKEFSELKALRELKMLRGRLAIDLTGNWMTNIPAEAEQTLINKKGLVDVRISWAKKPSDSHVLTDEEIKAHRVVLEKLKPHENLKILRIEGYKGKYFPSWANRDMMLSLPNLVIISIDGCSKCRFLPPFGQLEHLKKLTLRHMDNVKFIEDVNSLEPAVWQNPNSVRDRPFFKSLEELTLHNFYNLEGWRKEVTLATIEQSQQTTPRSFTCLSMLRIWNCPKLTSFPSFAQVSDLNLRNVNRLLLEESEKKARKLKSKFCTKTLQIMSCLDLESFGAVRTGLGGLPSLTHLVIEDCNAIISLADEVGKIHSLEKLEISSCKELDLSDDSEAPGRGHIAFIVSSVQRSPWKNFRSLHDLKLKEIPKMKTLPNGLKHVKTLKSLSLSACQSLESLPEWMGCLTALQYLRIESCRALKMLPEGLKYIKSLKKVEITECPALMERCREHKGEDWQKIKHARVLLHKSRRYGYV